jgi:hypothetical protein
MLPKTLDDLTGPWKRTTQIVYRDCPVCSRDTWKLYVAPDTGMWHCFGCHAAGRLDMGNANALAVLFAKKSQGPPKWNPVELPPFSPLSDAAHTFLAEKYGLTREQSARYSLVEGAAHPYVGRIIIPYFDARGDTIYYNARVYLGNGMPKYKAADGKHPLYFPRWSAKGWLQRRSGELVLVEGAFDAIKMLEAGYLGCAIGGTSLPRHLLPSLVKLAGRSPVTIALDSDALDKALALQRRLQPFLAGEVRTVMLPAGHDPGSMSIDQLQEVLQ